MKKVIAVLLVMGLIFAVTYITQFTGTDVTSSDDKSSTTMPLLFAHQEIKRNPTSDDPHDRYFPGFYEMGSENSCLFWFRNERPEDVSFGFRGFSCSSCTSARMAVIPQQAVDELVTMSALPVLPIGFGGIPTLLPAVAGASLFPKLKWTDFGVDKFDLVTKIPPAEGKNRPTWGVLRIGFKAIHLGRWDPTAAFYAQAAGARAPTDYPFQLHFIGVESFDVFPKELLTGDLVEGAAPAKTEIYFWSVIREPSELPPPVVTVRDKDPFVVVDPPIPMSEDELDRLATRLMSQKSEAALKLRSGYRIPVTIRSDAPGRLPDIGAFEKEVFVTGPGDRVHKVGFKGRVTGLVWLQDAQQVDLKSYSGKLGTETTVTLVSGRPDLELSILPKETKPTFLQPKLAEPKSEPGRKTWALTLTVPPEQGIDPQWVGWVVLQTKGPNPQKVRIPVMGNGRR